MEDETIDDFCLILKSGTSLVLDLTLKGQQLASSQALGSASVPYLHLDSSNRQFVLATADFFGSEKGNQRGAGDALEGAGEKYNTHKCLL